MRGLRSLPMLLILMNILMNAFLLPGGARAAEPADSPVARSLEADEQSGTASAVAVRRVPLAHTTQFLPLDEGGAVAEGEAAGQADHLLSRLDSELKKAGSGLAHVVKLNVYVADAKAADAVRRALAERFRGALKPAVCFVETRLPHSKALVAMDAVAWAPANSGGGRRDKTSVAILPRGRVVYISGQAEPGASMAEATRRTLESLGATLEHLGLGLDSVVQVKSFLAPMSSADESRREIEKFFEAAGVPPVAFVEWTMSAPIEIEIVAAGGEAERLASDPVECITPPGMQASPVFCRVTRVDSDEIIYVSGLYGTGESAKEEVESIFRSLEAILAEAGSDLRHLAKATYYVSTEEASTKLNELRPRFYDAKRPPAASKAPVTGTGKPGRTLTLDMIAVPAPRSADRGSK